MYKCCYGLLLALFLFACEGREMFCLRQAEELAESNPELALKHLDSVKSPTGLGKDNLLNYYFLNGTPLSCGTVGWMIFSLPKRRLAIGRNKGMRIGRPTCGCTTG